MELSDRLGQRLDLAGFDVAGFDIGAAEEDTPAKDRSVSARLTALVAQVSGANEESLTSLHTLDDAHVSSLDRIELAVRAEEEFGVRAEEVLAGADPGALTIGQLAQRLERLAAGAS